MSNQLTARLESNHPVDSSGHPVYSVQFSYDQVTQKIIQLKLNHLEGSSTWVQSLTRQFVLISSAVACKSK